MSSSMRERVAQSVTDGRMSRRRGASRVREALIRWGGDPTIAMDVDGTTLDLPLSHELPHIRKKWPSYAENLGEVAHLVSSGGGKTMIDIGANVGDSAAIVKAHAPDMAILCIDADRAYLPFLRRNTACWPDVEIAAPVLLAQRTGELSGEIARAGGTSRFDYSGAKATSAVRLDDLLNEHRQFSEPALLKSDTDGFEGHVLRGASSTLRSAGPVLFLEYDPSLLRAAGSNGLEILRWLRSFDYDRIAFYDKFGKLVLRCALSDEALLEELDSYVGNKAVAYEYFDLVVVTPNYYQVLDALTA